MRDTKKAKIKKNTKQKTMSNETFTVEKALKIQAEQLEGWKQVLNTETYMRIENEIEIRNASGYNRAGDVIRGTEIAGLVYKIMDKYRNDKIKN